MQKTAHSLSAFLPPVTTIPEPLLQPLGGPSQPPFSSPGLQLRCRLIARQPQTKCAPGKGWIPAAGRALIVRKGKVVKGGGAH
jgi:hypothetical protein